MKETVIVIGYETSYLEYKIKSLGYNVFPINYFSKKNLWKNLNITNLEKISRDLKKTSKKILTDGNPHIGCQNKNPQKFIHELKLWMSAAPLAGMCG